MTITAAQLKKLFPTARADLLKVVVDHWSEAEAVGITTPRRIKTFLANVGVETGGLRAVEENMNYTTTAQLQKTWPTRFKTAAAAKPYVRNPEALAIKVYGNRLGNKPAPSTDGWDYRGGGMMQTTGRENYAKMGFEDHPEKLREPLIAFQTALREWQSRGCNSMADLGDRLGVRKKINGGTNGLAEMEAYYKKADSIWPDTGEKTAPKPRPRPAPKPAAGQVPNPKSEIILGEQIPHVEPVREDQQPITEKATVELAQTMLKNLGYTEVGIIDGKPGDLTATAVMAFRRDNGMRLVDFIDHEMMLKMSQAKPRQLSTARTEATPAEVREKVPEAKSSWFSKIGAMWATGAAVLASLANGIFENIGPAKELFSPIATVLTDIPIWVYLLLIAAAAGAMWYNSQKAETKVLQAFQTGERR